MGTPAELARRLGTRASIELDVGLDAEPRAVEILTNGAFTHLVEQGSGRIRLGGVAREEIPALVARLVGAGVPVFGVAAQEPTLEDAYFALVNQERT